MKVLSSALLALVTVSGSAFASISGPTPEGTKSIMVDTNRLSGAVDVIAIDAEGSMKLIRQSSVAEIKAPLVQTAGLFRQNDYTIQNEADANVVVGGRRYLKRHDEVHDLESYDVDPSFSSSHQRSGQRGGSVESVSPDYVVPVDPGYGPGYGPGPGFGPGPGYGPGPGFDQGIPLRRR